MRARLAALNAVAILFVGTSAVNADILCAVKVGYIRDALRDRPGPNCPVGERRVNPTTVGLQGPPGQNASKGIAIYDCSICIDGKLTLFSTCESLEPASGFGHPPGAAEGVRTMTQQCKLVGYLVSPTGVDQQREHERSERRDQQ
jgi:hypothetical protein